MKTNLFFTIFMVIILLASCKKDNTKPLDNRVIQCTSTTGECVSFPIVLFDTAQSDSNISLIDFMKTHEIEINIEVRFRAGSNTNPCKTYPPFTYATRDISLISKHSICFRPTLYLEESITGYRFEIRISGHFILDGTEGHGNWWINFTPDRYVSKTDEYIVLGENTQTMYFNLLQN